MFSSISRATRHPICQLPTPQAVAHPKIMQRPYTSVPHQSDLKTLGRQNKKISKTPSLKKSLNRTVTKVFAQQGKNPRETFFECAKLGVLSTIELLVQADLVDINALDPQGHSALHHAMQIDDIAAPINEQLVLWLLKNGAKPDASLFLHRACIRNSADLIQALHETYRLPINRPDDFGSTPLHYAAAHGHAPGIEFLLEHRADMLKANSLGYCPVIGIFAETCAGKRKAALDIFLRHGLDVNFLPDGDSTLLQLAIHIEDVSLVEHLVERGADIHLRCHGLSPVYAAILCENLAIVELLLSKGGSIDPVTEEEIKVVKDWTRYAHVHAHMLNKWKKLSATAANIIQTISADIDRENGPVENEVSSSKKRCEDE